MKDAVPCLRPCALLMRQPGADTEVPVQGDSHEFDMKGQTRWKKRKK
jgi:hypothetical protein